MFMTPWLNRFRPLDVKDVKDVVVDELSTLSAPIDTLLCMLA
jgi:hypothetical protein